MRFQRHNLNTLEGRDFGIWNELLVVDIRANGTKDFAYFHVGEGGGTAWGVFNVWGNVTLRNASRGALKRGVSIFRATTDDQAIMVNIFGDVTIDGNLSNLIGYVRAYAAVIVHHGATLCFTECGVNLRGNLLFLVNGGFIQPHTTLKIKRINRGWGNSHPLCRHFSLIRNLLFFNNHIILVEKRRSLSISSLFKYSINIPHIVDKKKTWNSLLIKKVSFQLLLTIIQSC